MNKRSMEVDFDPALKVHLVKILTSIKTSLQIVNAIKNFLIVSWCVEDVSSLNLFKEIFLYHPIEKLLTEEINKCKNIKYFYSEHIKLIVNEIIKGFSDDENNSILIEEIFIGLGLLKEFSTANFTIFAITYINYEALTHYPSPIVKIQQEKYLQNITDTRIKFFQNNLSSEKTGEKNKFPSAKNYTDLFFNSAKITGLHPYLFFLFFIMISFFLIYYFNPQNLGLVIPIALMSSTLLSNIPNIIVSKLRFISLYLFRKFIEIHILKRLLLNYLKIIENFIDNDPFEKYKTCSPNLETSQTKFKIKTLSKIELVHNFFDQIFFIKSKDEIHLAKVKIKTQKQKLKEELKLINVKSKEKIEWNKEDKEIKLVISYPMFKHSSHIFKLWTNNPSQKDLNNKHYVYWPKDEVKKLFKNKKELYNGFLRIAQLGHIAPPFNAQGYVYCGHYENYPFKIKSLKTGFSHHRLFLKEISKTKLKQQDKILYEPAYFK